jgi:predicted phosphodiesterase
MLKALTPALLALLSVLPSPGQTVLIKPYVQPGDGSTLSGSDVKVISWFTDPTPGEFTIEYMLPGEKSAHTAAIARMALDFEASKTKEKKAATPDPKEPATSLDELKEKEDKESYPAIAEGPQHLLKYTAVLANLPFDREVSYLVKLKNAVVREGKFKTRASSSQAVRAVLVGDIANGQPQQKGIAWQIAQQKPELIVALGDIVYSRGRVSQYRQYFWPCFNDVAEPGPKAGAPLMASIPIYPVLGNHDADNGKLKDYPDAFGAYFFFNVPLNGPGLGPWNTPLNGDAKATAAFRQKAGPQYPAMNVYSFDYGPAHFVVLDSNSYSNKSKIEQVMPWVTKDLAGTEQPWKIVCFHAPAFHTSREHFTEQRMRLFQPVFEAGGVDVVFAGHVHNYQRSMPLKFKPSAAGRDAKGRVNGEFQLDQTFDGAKDTTPEGIVHLVSGGGGAKLYSVNYNKTIEYLKKTHAGNWVPFTAKYYAEKHSFSVVEITPLEFQLRQIDIDGEEIDRFKMTKALR